MRIYPAIDIKNGKCVRLSQGKFDDVTVFYEDPAEVAVKWQQAGASYIHVVDLDGARLGSGHNSNAIERILKAVNIPVQLGGGIRNMDDIKQKLDMGVSRVILGTAAISSPDTVEEAVKRYGEKIAVGIDAKNGKVAVSGWLEVSEVGALDLCRRVVEVGVKTIIYTDISKDGMMMGPNVEATKEIIEATGIDIIASGGVSCKVDLDNIRKIKASGVIVGKALYNGALDLKEIITEYEENK